MSRNYVVTAWGMFFSMVHGWQIEPDLQRLYGVTSAGVVKEVQPGVVVLDVSA